MAADEWEAKIYYRSNQRLPRAFAAREESR
jgi:hypothetical protein